MSDHNHNHDHDGGLAKDLEIIGRIMARRKALGLLAGVGTVGLLSGCGGSSASGTTSTTTTTTGSGTTTVTPTPSPTPTTSSGTCVQLPAETAGPYPGDGTNTSAGSTSNVLTASGIVRSDIRPSFLTTTTVATGTQVTITLTVVDVNSCGPLAGYAVYLWHCDRSGNYSLYSGATTESYLRGVQVTNSAGQVTFTTIYPACYSGRFPHMHFEVFSSLANATSGRFAVLTSQLAMPAAASAAVFADTTLYPGSASRSASITLSNDGIFGDNTTAQNTAMTPTYSGSVSAGYTMAATIGIAR